MYKNFVYICFVHKKISIFTIQSIFVVNFIFIFGSCHSHFSQDETLNQTLIFPDIKRVDVVLGAMFPIHAPSNEQGRSCGELQGEDGILPLEVLLFSIDQINADENLLPGITLGALALDSCNSPEVALIQSLKFIKGFIASDNAHHTSEFTCPSGGRPVYAGGIYDKIVGVIGGQHSSVSIQIANVMRLFNVPQISYRSTSPSLSDKIRFPYFLRTVPTDNNQALVMLELMKYLNIRYVSIVYSATDYGVSGYNELIKLSANYNICFANPPLSVNADDDIGHYDNTIGQLLARDRAQGVVFFGDLETAVKLLKSAKKANRRFFWIGSDAWTAHSTALNEYGSYLEGSIGVQPLAKTLDGFEQYFTNLTPYSNTRNPWFTDYWEKYFECRLETDHFCSTKNVGEDGRYVNIQWLHFVKDAVFAFAHGLHNMWAKLCGETRGLCEEMVHEGHLHGEQLFQYIKNVSFRDSSDQTFQFQETGSGVPRYTIFMYRGPEKEKTPWIPIGDFRYVKEAPMLSFYNSSNPLSSVPNSSCGMPCSPYQAKIFTTTDGCCWNCEDCTDSQYLNASTKFCTMCDKCQQPDPLKMGCVEKDANYLRFDSEWVVTSMAFSCLGILSSIFVGIIFWVHIDTPVIKAASRELSFILLGGIMLSFVMTFIILSPPSTTTCALTRFFMGFAYTVCYASILTKTNRISRIFNKNPSKPQKARYTSPISQVVIVSLLVSVEVIINASWLTYYIPEVKKTCDFNSDRNTLICKGIDDFSYIVGFIYPFSLVCLCTIYAIKTRKCPDGFNESKYIAFTNCTSCLLWLIFVPLYISSPTETGLRSIALVMSLSLGAFVQLGCLFIPKVHIVLFKPQKNTKESVMAQPRSTSLRQHSSMSRQPHTAPADVILEENGDNLAFGNVRKSLTMNSVYGRKPSRESRVSGYDISSILKVPNSGSESNMKD